MNRNHIGLLAGMVMAIGAATHASAQSAWDAHGDFSLSSNPNGAWSYNVQMPDGSTVPLTYSNVACRGIAGLDCWNTDGDFELPMIGTNVSGAPIYFTSFVIPLETLNMHPGANGERPTLTWTAPATGTYRITGHFQMSDKEATGVEVLVKQGSAVLVDKSLVAFGDTAPFNLKRKVVAGQSITFSVDAAGNYANDSTQLKASVLQLK